MVVGGLPQLLRDENFLDDSLADLEREVEEWMGADLVVGAFVIRWNDHR